MEDGGEIITGGGTGTGDGAYDFHRLHNYPLIRVCGKIDEILK